MDGDTRKLLDDLADLHNRPGQPEEMRSWLARASATITRLATPPEPAPVADGWQMVPVAALKWLFGEGPDDKGQWFGEGEQPPGAFWWRTPFRRMLSAAPSPPPRASDADVAALVEAEAALSSCYNVQFHPGDGTSDQDRALRIVRAALARIPGAEGRS